MIIRISCTIAAAGLAFALSTVEAEAQSKCVSAKTDWSVCVQDRPKECWGVSTPKSSANTRDGKPVQVRRGDTMMFVTFRPGAGARGEVSFTPGYAFAKGARAQVQIGNDNFTLYTDGEWAWPANANDDAAILSAMKRGAQAVVSASSARGTDTRDTFSLQGFTAAMQEAENRCK